MRSHGSKGWYLAAAVVSSVAAALAARRATSPHRRFSFHDKVVFITGGEGSLGLVMARELANRGAHLALCGRDAEALERACDELTGLGAYVIPLPYDVTDRAQIEAAVHCALQHFGRIDVLINNAGALPGESDALMMLEDYEETMHANFWAPLYATLAVLPTMRQQGGGRIVNISSIGGKRMAAPLSLLNELPYSTGKYALAGLSAGLRAELERDGIVVTTVCPGLIRPLEAAHTPVTPSHEGYGWLEVADSPLDSTVNTQRAARQILAACQRGDAELALSREARIVTRLHHLFPGLMADARAWMHTGDQEELAELGDEDLAELEAGPSPMKVAAGRPISQPSANL